MDAQWARIEHLLPGKVSDPDRGRSGADTGCWSMPCGDWRAERRFGVTCRLSLGTGASAFAVPALDTGGCLGESFQGFMPRSRLRMHAGRCDDLQRTCRCERPERRAETHAIGRPQGGLITKIHAAVDALGLPIQFTVTPGEWGGSPQARRLIEALEGVGYSRPPLYIEVLRSVPACWSSGNRGARALPRSAAGRGRSRGRDRRRPVWPGAP